MDKIENEDICFWKEDGILYSEYKHSYHMTLENSKEIYALRAQISASEPQYFCYDISNLKSMSNDARKYGELYGMKDLAASAIIVNSHVTLFIYNIFLKLHKVKIPTKAFFSRAEGVAWLNQIKRGE
jgi:hypothetical protein